jgi:hypothetical protein
MFFFLATESIPAQGPTQPPIPFPGGKAAKVKSAWSYTPPTRRGDKNYATDTYVFMAWCLVKHRDNFAFTFL